MDFNAHPAATCLNARNICSLSLYTNWSKHKLTSASHSSYKCRFLNIVSAFIAASLYKSSG
jgi:hypothetical protein